MEVKKNKCDYCKKSLKTFKDAEDEWEKGDNNGKRNTHKKCHKLRWDEFFREERRNLTLRY